MSFQSFPAKPFIVFSILIISVVIVGFLPDKWSLFPSVKIFYKRVTRDRNMKIYSEMPPEPEKVTSEIEDVEKSLDNDTTVGKSVSPVKTVKKILPYIEKGHLMKPEISRIFEIPCVKEGPGCKKWALDTFFESLDKIKSGKQSVVTWYGDSITSGDKVISAFRDRIQKKFGDSGPGFVFIKNIWHWQTHSQLYLSYNYWNATYNILKNPVNHRMFGLGGILVEKTGMGGMTTWKLRESYKKPFNSIVFHFIRHPEGGDVSIRIRDRVLKTFSTAGKSSKEDYIKVDGFETDIITVETLNGFVQSGGAVLSNNSPGVSVDTISLTGARMSNLATMKTESMLGNLDKRGTRLMVMQFGLNESDGGIDDNYKNTVRKVMAGISSRYEKMSCLIIGPTDVVRKYHGEYQTKPVIHHIIEFQREIARNYGCAYFNAWKAMGGNASVVKWYERKPRLAVGDLTHFTDEGGALLGSIIYLEVIKAYRRYLKDQGSH